MDTSSAPGKDQPKKYIRTLESDMATLKKGGIPDLTPLEEISPAPAAPPKATEPPVAPPPEPPPEPSTKRPEITLPVEPIPTFSQIVKKTPLPPPPPPPPAPPPVPPPELKPLPEPEPSIIAAPSPIETYAGDFTDRMKDTHASTATVLAAEQDSLQGAPQITLEPRHNNLPYIIAGTLLLIAGVAGAYVGYTRYLKITAPVFFKPSASAPIFVDDREQISGEGADLAQAIEQSVGSPLAAGTVRLLYTASSTDNTESVFAALNASAPDILLRNVQAAGSMAGVVNVDGDQSPFFILSVLSYSDTFSGMLSWEPRIRDDLQALFPPYPVATSTPIVTTSTSTSIKKSKSATKTSISTVPAIPPAPTAFVDSVVANHDVRIYRDAAGRSVLMYGYWNQATLIIAHDPAAFTEILQRLATSRAQ
ncbi:MAG: hypothetical protein ACYC75_00705 [Minisyncoccota bacterium]